MTSKDISRINMNRTLSGKKASHSHKYGTEFGETTWPGGGILDYT
jgi:hypothetical protein